MLQELQWLPVRRRVNFKMATLVYLSGMALAYLAADYQLVSDEGRCQLRSAATIYFGDMFCSCRSEAVNSLPAELRHADISFQPFKRLLKIFLFWC